MPQYNKEEFYQLLRSTTDNNVDHTRGTMFHKAKLIRDNKDIVILSGSKDNSIVIMNKNDYNKTLDDMVNEGIQQRKSKETGDDIL